MKKPTRYKHSLGQNFITDEFILEDIATLSKIGGDDFILEIGPGNGALTRCLLDRAFHVVTVEIDSSLLPLLKSNLKDYQNLSIINADFLRYDFQNILDEFCKFGFDKDKNHIKVVANLPYYITSPIIQALLLNPYIEEMTIMVQKEVAERICAGPGGKEYGVLTLACNFFSKTTPLLIVTKDCFFPVPKVDSAVVNFIKHSSFINVHDKSNFHIEDDPSYKKLFSIIKASFSERRKKLVNSLVNAGKYEKDKVLSVFKELGFDEFVRAENLSLSDYQNLAKLL